MASMTMTAASFLGGSAAASISKQSPTATATATIARRSLVVAKASNVDGEMMVAKEESSNGRRELVFAAAAAAACSVANIAMAVEPKRGTIEAKKKYAPVCVTMPTARICRN